MDSYLGDSSEQPAHAEVGSASLTLKGEDAWDHIGPITVGSDLLYLGGVFDGHGGKRAALHCRKHLLAYLVEALNGDASSQSIRSAAVHGWRRAHAEVIALEHGTVTDGCTATACILNMSREELTTINVGDSAAMLVPDRKSSKAAMLTEDHRLSTSEPERQRVSALGATLAHAKRADGRPRGPLRVFPGGVAQARAIGDADVGIFIDPTPAAHTTIFPSCGFAVLICSDGVWDAMLPSAVAGAVRRLIRHDAERSARYVCHAATSQWYAYDQHGYKTLRDDTTCVMMRVRRPTTRWLYGCLARQRSRPASGPRPPAGTAPSARHAPPAAMAPVAAAASPRTRGRQCSARQPSRTSSSAPCSCTHSSFDGGAPLAVSHAVGAPHCV